MLDVEADPAPLREGELLAETDAQQVEVLHDLPGARPGSTPAAFAAEASDRPCGECLEKDGSLA